MTGDREQIYNLARKSFLVAKEDPLGGENQMIHTENFVLIDKEKRIRGCLLYTSPSPRDKTVSRMPSSA